VPAAARRWLDLILEIFSNLWFYDWGLPVPEGGSEPASSPASPLPHHLLVARSSLGTLPSDSGRDAALRDAPAGTEREASLPWRCVVGSKGGAGGSVPSASAPACSGVRSFARGSGRAAQGERRKGRGNAARAPGDQTAGGERSRVPRAGANWQLCPFHAAPAPLRREASGGGEGRVTRHGCLLNSSAGSGG